MATAKKSATKKSATKKASSKKSASKGAGTTPRTKAGTKRKAPAKQTSQCWPGFEPTPGKEPGTKGSCKPKAGPQSAAVKKADQKAAAASKLSKQGKPYPPKK